jgi:hypothetical protein
MIPSAPKSPRVIYGHCTAIVSTHGTRKDHRIDLSFVPDYGDPGAGPEPGNPDITGIGYLYGQKI